MIDLNNILVPTDFSDSSLRALEFAQCMARQHNSLIHLLHVVEPDYVEKAPQGYESLARFRRARIMDAEEEVRRFLAKISISKTEITEAILEGFAPERILSYAGERRIDLILISTHGKGNSFSQQMGKVADKVLRKSELPVIIVKANVPVFTCGKVSFNRTWAENWVG